jgi:hypothetical protein
VKRCLARFAEVKPQLHCEDAMNCAATKNEKLEAVGHHLPYGVDIGLMDFGQLLELAHALGGLGTEQVTLAGMHADNFAIGGDLETLARAAMGLQLQFGFLPITWHCFESSPCGPSEPGHF